MSFEIISALEKEKFDNLLANSGNIKEGILISATLVAIENDNLYFDLGLKSRGVINKNEFNDEILPKIGESVTVLLESLEDCYGNISISYVKALRKFLWNKLLVIYNKMEFVKVKVLRLCIGGCEVNLLGVTAFVPKARFPLGIKDAKEMIGNEYTASIMKLDEVRNVIIVSLKNNVENDGMVNFTEGQIVKGVVKEIKENYALILIDSSLARLNASEVSWEHFDNISNVLKKDQQIEVKVISTNGSKIFVSLKALQTNPWAIKIKEKNITVGKTVDAKIIAMEENALICKFDDFECKLKSNEISWIKKLQVIDGYKKGDIVKAKIKIIDENKNKIYLSIKELEENPFKLFAKQYKVGDKINGEVVSISEIGYVIKLPNKLEGVVPMAAVYLYGSFKIKDKVSLYIFNISVDTMQIVLGNRNPA